MTMTCGLCHGSFPAGELNDHLRMLHPDVDARLAHWPDGGLVFSEVYETPADVG